MAMKKDKFLSLMAFLLCLFHQNSAAYHPSQESPAQMNLKTILKKAEEYCHRLENGVYDFVCKEEISENINYSRDIEPNSIWAGAKGLRTKYLYDYQLVKKGYGIKESRILIERNGRQLHEENALLETRVFRHQHVLLRTVDLFNEFGNTFDDYSLIGEETMFGEEAIVIEAVPKAPYEQRLLYGSEPSYLSGKIWLKKKDFSILKIMWNPGVIKEIKNTEEIAKRYKAEPMITIISEYKFEKNGIRFPSRLYIEEAYGHKGKKEFVRSETDIVYRDYKFFTVETEVKY
jgi:hypothetical protein